MIPALLHLGDVTHVRHAPPMHRFRYRLWMISLDLDRIDEVARRSWLFRHNRTGLVALHDRDHGPRDGSPLRPWVEAELRAAGLGDAAAHIRVMLIPRLLGYAFNPIAFYFCHDATGALRAVLHQVKNTFGGQHAYVLPVAPGDGPVAQAAEKALYVSPFFDCEGGYRFAFTRPDFTGPNFTRPNFTDNDGRFDITIRYGAEQPRMTAHLALATRKMNDTSLLRALLGMPLLGLKVIAAIHWEALRLWLRGAKLQPETKPDQSTPTAHAG